MRRPAGRGMQAAIEAEEPLAAAPEAQGEPAAKEGAPAAAAEAEAGASGPEAEAAGTPAEPEAEAAEKPDSEAPGAVEAEPAKPAGRGRGSMLAATEAEPEPEPEPEAPGTAGATEPEAAPAAEAPAPAPAARGRRSTTLALAEAEGDMARHAPAEGGGEAAAPSAAADGVKEKLDIPELPTDPNGLPVRPANAEARIAANSRGESFKPNARPVDGGAEEPGSAPANPGGAAEKHDKDDKDEKDDISYAAVDGVHAALMAALTAPYATMNAVNAARAADAEERKARATQALQSLTDPRQQDPRASMGRAPGLFAGIGSAIANAFSGPDIATQARQELLDSAKAERREAEAELGKISFAKKVVAKQYKEMADAANAMYVEHVRLNGMVAQFNAKFEASDEGQKYLRKLQYVADKRGISVGELRERIHDLADNDLEISKLRHSTSVLANDPEFAPALQQMGQSADKLRRCADAFENRLGVLQGNGVDLSAVAPVAEHLKQMQVQDAALSEPGGRPLHRMQEEMKKMMEQMSEMIRNLAAGLSAVIAAVIGPKRG